MQQSNSKDNLLKQRREIISKYDKGPIKDQTYDWENPQYSIYHETDYYGFIHDGGIKEDFLLKETKIRKLDRKREIKWRKLLEKKSGYKSSRLSQVTGTDDQYSYLIGRLSDSSFHEEIMKRVYKGVPQKFKLTLWHVFLDIDNMRLKKPKVYQVMLKKALEKSPDVHQIDLDVNRTFRNTTYFRERYNDRQKALFHVLAAYSMYNTEIGYCQGMSEIAGLLLMYLVDEEDVFWGLSQLMTSPRYCMHGMFVVGFPRLLTFFNHLNNVLQKLLPKIAKHFEKLELMSSAYALKWFMQCFLDRVPFTLFLRLWDIYLLEGEKLLIAMAYNIIKLHKKRIIKMDHCAILQFFQNELRKDFHYDDDFVIESLKNCIEELRKYKLSAPPPTQSNELPTRPFGTDADFQTPSLASVKERQSAQANPEEVIRRSIKKQKQSEHQSNSIVRKSPSRLIPEEKNLLTRSSNRESNSSSIPNDQKPEIDTTINVPSHIRYRINNSNSKMTPMDDDLQIKIRQNHDSHGSLKKTRYSHKTEDRHLVKSVPDLSNNHITDIPRSTTNTASNIAVDKLSIRRSLSPESNHITVPSNPASIPITKSQTMSSFQRPKRKTVLSSPETML